MKFQKKHINVFFPKKSRVFLYSEGLRETDKNAGKRRSSIKHVIFKIRIVFFWKRKQTVDMISQFCSVKNVVVETLFLKFSKKAHADWRAVKKGIIIPAHRFRSILTKQKTLMASCRKTERKHTFFLFFSDFRKSF